MKHRYNYLPYLLVDLCRKRELAPTLLIKIKILLPWKRLNGPYALYFFGKETLKELPLYSKRSGNIDPKQICLSLANNTIILHDPHQQRFAT